MTTKNQEQVDIDNVRGNLGEAHMNIQLAI